MMKTILTNLKLGATLFIATCLIACGGGSGGASSASNASSSASSVVVPPPPVVVPPLVLEPDVTSDSVLSTRDSAQWDTATDAARFLAQASLGATAKDIDYIVNNSKEAWLDNQFLLPQTVHLALLDARLRSFNHDPTPPYAYFEDMDAVWRRHIMRSDVWWESAIWSRDQLRQRVAFALSQVLVVSLKGADLYARERGFSHYHDLLAKHALGNYRDLLMDVSQSPIMEPYNKKCKVGARKYPN